MKEKSLRASPPTAACPVAATDGSEASPPRCPGAPLHVGAAAEEVWAWQGPVCCSWAWPDTPLARLLHGALVWFASPCFGQLDEPPRVLELQPHTNDTSILIMLT